MATSMFSFLHRPTPITLALQGGGAHGAFTWGVLDRLLEDGRFPISAISGTSAGAVNAVALASGLLDAGNDGARAALARMWQAMSGRVQFDPFLLGSADKPSMVPAARAWMQWARLWSPQQLNPLGLNPLRDVLVEQIDFERLRAQSKVRLFIAATHANSGRLRLFGNAELSADAVLASACLPTLQPSVMIDGEPYWDGGYSANPALFPLVRSGVADLLIVWLSPLAYDRAPVSAQDIRERALEFAFNATFLREAHMLADLCAGARSSGWPFGRLARLRMHLIDAHDALGALAQETKLITHGPFLHSLRDRGRERATLWLEGAARRVGKASSVDLAAMFASPGA